VFFRIWLRLVIAVGALIIAAAIMRATGIAPYGVGLFSGALAQIVFLILMASMTVAMAVTVTAPFHVPNDLLIPWALHRETGTPPERTPEQQTALSRIREESKNMPKGGTWALGVRIVYTDKGQIVWAPTQVLYGALATFAAMLMVARIMGGIETSSWELLTEQYTRPIWLIGGAAGLMGGSIGRNYKEALVMAFCSCGFAIAAAVLMSNMLHPWLKTVIPGVLYALCYTLIFGRLFLPRLRRFGRMAHYGLVGIVVPSLVAGGIFYLAQRHAAECERDVRENKINVNWIWPTSGARLLMVGYVELYGGHWLWQRDKIGGVWAIEPQGKKLHYLTPGRAVQPTFKWSFLWGLKEYPKLNRMAIPQVPNEIGRLMNAGNSFNSVHFTGRIEPVPDLDLDEELEEVAEQATRTGIKLDDKDISLIKKTMGDQPGPWSAYPYPLRPAFFVEGGGERKDRKAFLIDLKDDRAYPLAQDVKYRGELIDGPRGLELLYIETVKGTASVLVAFNLKNQTQTLLTGNRENLKLAGVTKQFALVKFGGDSWYDKRYALARLDQSADVKVLAWPDEEMRYSTIAPGKLIHAWTDKHLHIIDPASGEERAVARPEEMERHVIGLKGYLGDDPIIELKNELKVLDTKNGKLKTLVKISSGPYI